MRILLRHPPEKRQVPRLRGDLPAGNPYVRPSERPDQDRSREDPGNAGQIYRSHLRRKGGGGDRLDISLRRAVRQGRLRYDPGERTDHLQCQGVSRPHTHGACHLAGTFYRLSSAVDPQ